MGLNEMVGSAIRAIRGSRAADPVSAAPPRPQTEADPLQPAEASGRGDETATLDPAPPSRDAICPSCGGPRLRVVYGMTNLKREEAAARGTKLGGCSERR